jgi:hypothetical protein
MSETKFKTFKDLKSLNNSSPSVKSSDSIESNTSIASKSIAPSNTSSPSISSIPSTPKTKDISKNTGNKKKTLPISPERDFQKVPNSVTREAVPAGFFRGKSKQVWDYLWSVSRGDIKPSRTVNRTRKQIKDGAGLGSMVTVDAAIQHLQLIGLIKVNQSIGSYSGNEYEIFSPEEVQNGYSSIPRIASISSNTSLAQKMDILDTPESSISRETQTIENKPTYSDAKTFFKDNKSDDDRAFAVFAKKFEEASQKLTGKGTGPNEAEKWGKLAELLILELELAARKSSSISSIPAFLTEVLRRRLILNQEEKSQPRSSKSNQKKPNWVDVGKNYDDVESSYNPVTGEYDIKPLDEAGKAKALELVFEAQSEGGGEFLEDLKKWYLPEDWEWLIKELNIAEEKKN